MIEERELFRLQEIQPKVPQLDHVVLRGQRIRRRRRVLHGSAGILAAAGIFGAVTFVGARSDETTVEVAAPVDMAVPGSSHDDAGDCGGYAELRDPDEAGVPRLLPEWLPPGLRIDHAWARAELTEARTCPAVPVALVAAALEADGAVTAAVRLEGPAPEPYRHYSGPEYQAVTARGDRSANLVRFPAVDDGYRQLQWTEPTVGTSWSLTSYGLDDHEILAVANALELAGAGSSPVAQLNNDAAGLTEVWNLDTVPGELPAEEPFWHAVIDDGGLLSIDVSRPLVPSPATAAIVAPDARIITVRGETGIVHQEAGQSSITWDEGDFRVRVAGSIKLEDLLRVAESLQPAAADDSRITSP